MELERCSVTWTRAADDVAWVERAGLVALLLLLFALGYFGVASLTDVATASSLGTRVDDAIPFVPAAVYLYALVYPAVLCPAFAVRSRTLFRRIARAYALTIAVAVLGFALFPTEAVGLRAHPAALDLARFDGWGVHVLYRLDPPLNLFPSLHVGLALLAALATRKAGAAWGVPAVAAVFAVPVAACVVKQHYVVDVLAGALLGAACYALVVRPHQARPDERLAFGWPAFWGWVSVTALAYLSAFAAFRCGLGR